MSFSNKIIYSLVIPCYNEEANLSNLIASCKEILVSSEYELVLVNNGSTDNTKNMLTVFSKQYSNITIVNIKKNIGYGDGILQGLYKASGKIIGWTHADNQTHPNDFVRAINEFKNNNKLDFVKGRRYGRPITDKFFSKGMEIFETILLRTNFNEINAQPNVFRKEFMNYWENPPLDFSLDLYVYFMAKKKGLMIKRINVFFGPRLFGNSKWNTGILERLKFIKRTIKFSLKLRKYLNGNNFTQKK